MANKEIEKYDRWDYTCVKLISKPKQKSITKKVKTIKKNK